MSETTGTETPRWVVLVELTSLPAWLGLDRRGRAEIVQRDVDPVLAGFPQIRVEWVDVEAFTGACSDVLIARTADLTAWNRLFERLRDTVLFSVPYFRVERILTGLTDGYRDVA